MESQELEKFLSDEKVRIGDTVRLVYSMMFSETVIGKVVFNNLTKGNQTVSATGRSVTLQEDGPYLMLNTRHGLTGAQVRYIDSIQIEARRGLTVNDYNTLKAEQGLRDGDTVDIYFASGDRLGERLKLVNSEAQVNYEGVDCLLFATREGGAEGIPIKSISEITKAK